MLQGDTFALRATAISDAEVIHRLENDLEAHLSGTPMPHLSRSVDAIRRHLEREADRPPQIGSDSQFVVTPVADSTAPVGVAALWGIDQYNRLAHIGVAIERDQRRRGAASESVRLLCEYGFRTRGLHRLEIDTLATNAGMRAVAQRIGFREEGCLRERHYMGSGQGDVIMYGLLRSEWTTTQA